MLNQTIIRKLHAVLQVAIPVAFMVYALPQIRLLEHEVPTVGNVLLTVACFTIATAGLVLLAQIISIFFEDETVTPAIRTDAGAAQLLSTSITVSYGFAVSSILMTGYGMGWLSAQTVNIVQTYGLLFIAAWPIGVFVAHRRERDSTDGVSANLMRGFFMAVLMVILAAILH